MMDMTNEASAARVDEAPDIVTSSDDYASRFEGTAGRYMLEVQRRSVLLLLNDEAPGSGRSIIDVGGGHNQLAEPLATHGFKVTVAGSDATCSARLRTSDRTSEIPFLAANLLDLPVADRQFDIAVSVRLISHLDRWRDLIAELCRVAARTVVIDYPTYNSLNLLGAVTFPVKRAIEKNTRTYRSFFDGSIRDAFASNGFTRTKIERQFVLPMALHRALPKTDLLRGTEERMRSAGLTRMLGNPVLARFDRMP